MKFDDFRLFLILPFLLIACSKASTPIENHLKGFTMGTSYSIKWYINQNSLDKNSIKKGVEEVLKEVNRKMSVFQKDSEISRFNNHEGEDWFEVSAGTSKLFKTALDIHHKSGGALDITIGPLIKLWGFGKGNRTGNLPSGKSINELLQKVGSRFLEVKDGAIRKLEPSIYCNLSSIAKGYGVDEVAEFMEKKGIESYLVEIGGETKVGGVKPGGRSWTIGIAVPSSETFGVQEVIPLKGVSMATSGDYRNYFEKGGVRYSHIINPSTGYPVKHTLASVTVIHKSCMSADAWATAIEVLGVDRGIQVAENNELAVYMIYREDKGFKVKMTGAFKKYLKK